jgi:asparagine synthase (glutamine-hydrolysing)
MGVRDHLISDVPVGIFLSSGLDSTLLAGLAARHGPDVRTFTVGFSDQPEFSEAKLAAGTAQQFGLAHVPINLTAAEVETAAREWLDMLDQPSMDGLNVFVISRAVQQHGIKVALSGQGGDELFGGYPSFRDAPRIRRLVKAMQCLPVRVRRGVAALSGVRRSVAYRSKLADMFGSDGSLLSIALQRRRALSDGQLEALGVEPDELNLTADFLPCEALDGVDTDEGDPVAAVSRLESQFYQGNVLLRDADANGMAHGLEIRVPFLDQRLLNLVHALPGTVRLPAGAPGKYLLRQAFASLLRPELQRQPKRGFTLPISRWMLGPLRDWCEQSIAAWNYLGWLRPEGVKSICDAFLREPESQLWTRAFTLCVTSQYLSRAGATF